MKLIQNFTGSVPWWSVVAEYRRRAELAQAGAQSCRNQRSGAAEQRGKLALSFCKWLIYALFTGITGFYRVKFYFLEEEGTKLEAQSPKFKTEGNCENRGKSCYF